jgi:hypothetical protein
MEGPVDEIHLQESELADWGFFAPDAIPEHIMPCCKQKVLDWVAYQGRPFLR